MFGSVFSNFENEPHMWFLIIENSSMRVFYFPFLSLKLLFFTFSFFENYEFPEPKEYEFPGPKEYEFQEPKEYEFPGPKKYEG